MNRTDINRREHHTICWKLMDGQLLWPPIGGTFCTRRRAAGILADKRDQHDPPVKGATLVAVRSESVDDGDWANKPEPETTDSRTAWERLQREVLRRCQKLAIGRDLYGEDEESPDE